MMNAGQWPEALANWGTTSGSSIAPSPSASTKSQPVHESIKDERGPLGDRLCARRARIPRTLVAGLACPQRKVSSLKALNSSPARVTTLGQSIVPERIDTHRRRSLDDSEE
jgi:hypothetical protein